MAAQATESTTIAWGPNPLGQQNAGLESRTPVQSSEDSVMVELSPSMKGHEHDG
jgi:hypothetical protein